VGAAAVDSAAAAVADAAAAVAVDRMEARMKRSIAALAAAVCMLASPLACAQQAYATPDAASEAFVDALRRTDHNALRTVLGPDWKRFISTDHLVKTDIETFLAEWQKQHKTITEADGNATLTVGDKGWTLPIPIVQSASGWRFDPRAGADEMRTRRIGRNELSAMQAVLAYFDAQQDYGLKDRDGNGVLEYAQKFASSPGKKDGLYWPDSSGQDPSPLGPLFASEKRRGPGYHGYLFKILKAQGKDAPGGAYDYIIGGRMRSGFALVAWPVRYGDTGVTSFMVSHDGTVVEKDLGPNTDATARAMTRFNPDATWKKAPVPGS
jgi:hypothetical protein